MEKTPLCGFPGNPLYRKNKPHTKELQEARKNLKDNKQSLNQIRNPEPDEDM